MTRRWLILSVAAAWALSSASATAQCTPDIYEEDDACIPSDAVIYGGDTQTHNFCQDAEDWINFNACTGRTYTIETSNLGTKADTVLELYDTDCALLLTSDNDGGVGLASKIDGWVAPADGTYHVKVLQLDATFGDNREYDITLTGDTSPCSTWAKTYGGSSHDYAFSVDHTSDGGCIVAGETQSFGAGNKAFWVLKLDVSGNVQWEKTYGDGSEDYARSIQQTTDGGYIVAGTTTLGCCGRDIWVLKLDAEGNVGPAYPETWQKRQGGLAFEFGYSAQQTSDDGFIVAGGTWMGGIWALKLDASGNEQWQKTYCCYFDDAAHSVQQTSDGGYIVAGTTKSIFGAGGKDFWVLKLDENGEFVGPQVTFQKAYGGADWDEAHSVQQTADGGFVVAGTTKSFGAGGRDFWVLKLDENGEFVGPQETWQKTYGGSGWEEAYSIQQTADGGFVVAGLGFADAWLLKLDASGNVTWQNTYGDVLWDAAFFSIKQTTDGGFIAVGEAYSLEAGNYDVLVLKLDANGNAMPLCSLGTTAVAGVNSSATVKDVSDSFWNTSGLINTSVTGVDSAATVGDLFCEPLFAYDGHAVTDCGNADGVIDPGETMDLNVTVRNTGDGDAFSVSGVLSTTTPGIVLTASSASFPDVPAEQAGASLTPFQFVVDAGVPCGTLLDFTLDLTYEDSGGNPFSNSITSTPPWMLVGEQPPLTLLLTDFEDCADPIVGPGSVCPTCVPPDGVWTVANGGTKIGWTHAGPGPGCDSACEESIFPTNYYVCDSFCERWSTDHDERLTSPVVDTSATATVTLRFDSDYYNYEMPAFSNVNVRSSLTSGAWVTLKDFSAKCGIWGDCAPAGTGSFVLDATAQCAGAADCQVEFHQKTTYYESWWWALDNVVVEGIPALCNPACCGLPYVGYDSAFNPQGTLIQVCGDGDLIAEPGEEWQATVQLRNFGCVVANNVKADLTVNVGSTVGAAVCNNSGTYGNIPGSDTAQFIYSFVVDSGAVCVNDVTFDVTGVVSDEGAGTDRVPAFNVTVGADTTESATAPDIDVFRDGVQTSAFAPPFTLVPPIASAYLDYTFTTKSGADPVACAKVELLDPAGTPTLIKDFGESDPAKPVDVTAAYDAGGPDPPAYQIRIEEQAGCGGNSQKVGLTLITLDVTKVVECDASACACPLSPPLEPSPVGSPDPLLIPTTAADQIIVEDVADETGYVVYEEAIGAWYGTPSQTCLDTWDDLGSTVGLGYSIVGPGDRWVVVSAANAAGESSCGTDSAGVERRSIGTWPAPGPCP